MFTLFLSVAIFCPVVVIAVTALQVYKTPNARSSSFLIGIRKSLAYIAVCFISFWGIAHFFGIGSGHGNFLISVPVLLKRLSEMGQ
jgi:hypothetical protein